MKRFTAAIPGILLALFALGCPDNPPTPCPEECGMGRVCDESTGECEREKLRQFDGEAPGRSVRLAAVGNRVIVAAVDPTTGTLIAGGLDGTTVTDWRILDQDMSDGRTRLALTAGPSGVSVAWLDDDGLYHLASRGLSESNALWTFKDVETESGRTYRGTRHFDLGIDADGSHHLVFRGRDHALKRLSTADLREDWSLELIDDGTTIEDACSLPEEADREGVGFYPALLVGEGELFVAYHDADCGDLRLARRGESNWSVSIVDSGGFEIDSGLEDVVVGRFASLAFTSAGRLAIAYQDVSRGRLLYAEETGEQFETSVADPGLDLDELSRRRKHLVGSFAQLSFDEHGNPAITYFDGTAGTLRVARRSSPTGSWKQRTLERDGVVGLWADHVYSPELGLIAVAERLVPTAEGLSSELVIERDGGQ